MQELSIDQAEEEAQGTSQVLDRILGLSEAAAPSTARREIPVQDVPRTTLEGLEATSPELHRDIVIELRAVRDMDLREPEPELLSESETSWPSEASPGSDGPGDAAPGASSAPRTAQGKRPPPQPPSSSSGSQNVALAGCDVSYQSDLVRVDNLPVVDMWSPDEDHIWGALDEGCNSTCHSKAWGELAEDRLRHYGLTFPWINSSAKSFAGLGSSTTTLGKRNLPFCIQVGEDSLAGAMESHEVDTEAFNPLLVSLFAQAKVGLINDMAQCRCYIGDLEVPMARCARTGLLLLCLSQFSRRSKLPRVVESLRVPSPGTRIAHIGRRAYGTLMAIRGTLTAHLPVRTRFGPDIMLVTAGEALFSSARPPRRAYTRCLEEVYLPKAIADRKIILTNTRQLANPEKDRDSDDRHCIGRHPGITDEQLSSGTGMYLLQSTWEAIEKERKT